MLKDYHPELNVSKELEDTNTYHQLIGILRWSCELSQIYILTEGSVLSHNICNPIDGHIDSVLHIFNYLNVKSKYIPGKLVFDDLEQPPYILPIKGASM